MQLLLQGEWVDHVCQVQPKLILIIQIKYLNPKKRPISAVADNVEVRNAKNILIKINKKIFFNLLYDRNNSLQKKIKIEQLRKETNLK